MTDTKHDELKQIGKNALSAIRDMVAALECDYERLAELRYAREALGDDWLSASQLREDAESEKECARAIDMWEEENGDELKELEEAAGECKDREDAEERIMEDPLEIKVRGDWRDQGFEDEGPVEFYILLTTGGPAVRIMGELQDGEPHRAYLQTQDWGTPWTDYYEEGAAEVLMSYCRCFCFGE